MYTWYIYVLHDLKDGYIYAKVIHEWWISNGFARGSLHLMGKCDKILLSITCKGRTEMQMCDGFSSNMLLRITSSPTGNIKWR